MLGGEHVVCGAELLDDEHPFIGGEVGRGGGRDGDGLVASFLVGEGV